MIIGYNMTKINPEPRMRRGSVSLGSIVRVMRYTYILFALHLLMASCNPSTTAEFTYPEVKPPVASLKPKTLVSRHGHERIDPYFWLNNREDQEVIDYLKAENAYLDTMLAHTQEFKEILFQEMKARIKEDDASVPYRVDDHYYYYRFVEGGEYPVYCRKKGSLQAAEEVIADGNELGKGKAFFNMFLTVSPDHNLAVLGMDTVGRNFYTLQVKDLNTGAFLSDKIDNTRGGVEWTNDNRSFYYSLPDPKTLRIDRVKRHFIGADAKQDELVYEEKDQTLDCGLSKSKSRKYIFIYSGRTDANCERFIDAEKPGAPVLIEPIRDNVKYSTDHAYDEDFMIVTNRDAVNYRLVQTPVSSPGAGNWKDVIPHRNDVFLEQADYFYGFMVLQETREGLARIKVIPRTGGEGHYIDFGEPAYSANLGYTPDMKSTVLRYTYTSLTTPNSTFDYDMNSREKKLMKEQPVLGSFDKKDYVTERIMVPARDGKRIPMSIVYHKDKFKKDGSNPGWIYAYGSYGSSMDPYFSSARLTLLDRGFVYAIAHIRGGQEMGGSWYEDGKMMKKKNTFYDFIDCSKWLQDNNYVAKDKLFASGGSAGGLLIGAVSNLAPEIYRGLVADVPFVDVVTTMMDETIPLTTFEWQEWGNPNIQEQYEYMLSYSPYDNVEKKAYPHMLVTTGLHDSQVQYWEPAKWVAKLRTMKTDKNNLFLHTNLDAGHGGASGRFERLKEVALQYVFAFDILGIRK